MPSAVPFQQGIIGAYNNSTSPGVYVSWDANSNFATTQSLVFKGLDNTNYRFPLILNKYTSSNTLYSIGVPAAIACGSYYYYVATSTTFIIYYKQGDNLATAYSIAISDQLFFGVPDTLLVRNYNNLDYIFMPIGSTGAASVYTFDGTTFTYSRTIGYDAITGLSLATAYTGSSLTVDKSNFYLTYQGAVYACAYTTNYNLDTTNRGIIINSSNGTIYGNSLKYISNYDDAKICVTDNQNYVYEFVFEGDISAGNTSSNWRLNFSLTPTNQVWSSVLYNHFGIIIATDSFNHTVNVITSSTVTVNTKLYGFNGAGYSVQSTKSSTAITGIITNTVGALGVEYLQFNSPLCIAEDFEFNILIGDLNNRFTYIPTALDYVASVQAPLNELIDKNGNPADTYYIKQTNDDYSTLFSVPPITGDELLIKSSVLYELNALLRVAVYDEEPLFGHLRQTATLTYGDIVTDPAPQIRITCSTNSGQRSPMFVLSPYSEFTNSLDQAESDPFAAPTNNNNYPNGLFYRFTNEGKLYFYDLNGTPTSIQEYDTILVTYYVKMFTNKQINNALYLALQAINAQPGINKISSVRSCPFYYDQTLVSGATYYLLRQLAVGLNSRERRLLVMDSEQSSFDAVANIKDTAKMYQEEFNELLKKLPIAVRPTMGTITTPEFALPGGRSRLYRQLWTSGTY